MGTDAPFRQRFLVGLVALALIVVAVAFGIQSGLGGFKSGYVLNASFERVIAGLEPGSKVKIRGVTVGEVKSINLEDDGRVTVALRMQNDARVADTAVASVEPLSIFGPKSIKLAQGKHETSGPFLEPGGDISETVRPVEFLETLAQTYRLFRAVNPEDLLTVVHTIAEGFGGMGPALSRTIDNAPRVTKLALDTVDDFTSLLRNTAPLTERLAESEDSFGQIARSLHVVLPEITARERELTLLLDDTAKLAGDAGGVIRVHRVGLTNLVQGVEGILGAVYSQLAALPDFLKALEGFGLVTDAVAIPGPHDTRLLAIRGFAPIDPCGLFNVSVCPVIAGPLVDLLAEREASPR